MVRKVQLLTSRLAASALECSIPSFGVISINVEMCMGIYAREITAVLPNRTSEIRAEPAIIRPKKTVVSFSMGNIL